jgi:hypothetical protein
MTSRPYVAQDRARVKIFLRAGFVHVLAFRNRLHDARHRSQARLAYLQGREESAAACAPVDKMQWAGITTAPVAGANRSVDRKKSGGTATPGCAPQVSATESAQAGVPVPLLFDQIEFFRSLLLARPKVQKGSWYRTSAPARPITVRLAAKPTRDIRR